MIRRHRQSRVTPDTVLFGVCGVVLLIDLVAPQMWAQPGVRVWSTVFAAICLQATPYVVLGAILATLINAAPHGWQRRWNHVPPVIGVPLLGLAGTALPGCECGSVFTASAMVERGLGTGPALAFMVSAPSANPVVLAATAAAFPGQPAVVGARFMAGVLLAMGVGMLAARGVLGQPRTSCSHHRHLAAPGTLGGTVAVARDEIVRALGLLTLGAAAATSMVVWVPRSALDAIAAHPVLSVITMAGLATMLCICSQADAFIARSFAGFSRSAQFAFMVVGPAVDLKLIAMQAGAFGPRFTARFSVVTFVLAVLVAVAVSAVML